MKKLLVLTALAASMASTSALAKTEGNQAGIDILMVDAEHKYEETGYGFDETSVGLGVNVKHAINFNNRLFIAPGAFAEYLGNDAEDGAGDETSLDYRFGAKVDFGVDLTNEFAAYVSVGYGITRYNVDLGSSGEKSGFEGDMLYGFGVAYNINPNTILGLEYNFQELDLDGPAGVDVNTDLNVLKVGLAFKF